MADVRIDPTTPRAVSRLLGELKEVNDGRIRESLALTSIRDLLKARVAVIAYMRHGRMVSFSHTELPSSSIRLLAAPYHGESDAVNLAAEQLRHESGALITKSRQELVPDRKWYTSKMVCEHLRPAGIGDEILSKRVLARGVVERLTVARSWADSPFTAADVRSIQMFHRYYAFGPRPCEPWSREGLSSLESCALELLLTGVSVKAIATRLHASESAVCKLTTSLYRYFDVSSRPELLELLLPHAEGQAAVRHRALAGAVPGGPKALTPRQQDTLAGLMTGAPESEIAASLGLSRHTLHEYVKALYRMYGVSSRGELMARVAGQRPILKER